MFRVDFATVEYPVPANSPLPFRFIAVETGLYDTKKVSIENIFYINIT